MSRKRELEQVIRERNLLGRLLNLIDPDWHEPYKLGPSYVGLVYDWLEDDLNEVERGPNPLQKYTNRKENNDGE